MTDQPTPENDAPKESQHWFHTPRTFFILLLTVPVLGTLIGLTDFTVMENTFVYLLWWLCLIPCSFACGYWLAARKFTARDSRVFMTLVFGAGIGTANVIVSIIGCGIAS